MSVGDPVSNEERPPYITFERRAKENKAETLKQGHYVGRDVDYVFVTLPGGRDVFASQVDKWMARQEIYAQNNRINPKWLELYKDSYERWQKGEEIPVNGTPIKGWQALSPAQTEIIIHAGIRTVEDLALVNDEGLRRLGMGGRDLVNKAKSWLKSASDHGQVALQNAALEKENESLKITVESLEEKVSILMQKVDAMDTSVAKRETPSAVELVAEMLPEGQYGFVAAEALPALYEKKFGKKPHWKMKDSTIRAKIEE